MRDQGFLLYKVDENCDFILLSNEHLLSIQATVTVNRSLEVCVNHKQQVVPSASYKYIFPTNRISLFSEVTNLLAFAENLATNQTAMKDTFKVNFSQLVNKQLEMTENDQHIRLLKFILEQVDLMYKSKNQR